MKHEESFNMAQGVLLENAPVEEHDAVLCKLSPKKKRLGALDCLEILITFLQDHFRNH